MRTHRDDQLLRQHVRELSETLHREIPEMQKILLRKHQESCQHTPAVSKLPQV